MSAGGLWFSSDSAISWACGELLRGKEISHPDEIAEAGGWRLGAIIWVLRHRYKWPIKTTRKGPRRIAFYRLERQATEPLELPASAKAKGGAENTPGTEQATDENGQVQP